MLLRLTATTKRNQIIWAGNKLDVITMVTGVSSGLGCDLHGDLMLEILTRLPVKALLRFKCVKKSWYALVNNPQFIEMHYDYWFNLDYDVLSRIWISPPKSILVGQDLKYNIWTIPAKSSILKRTGIKVSGIIKPVGVSKGLICLTLESYNSSYGYEFLVINPALRECKMCKKLIHKREKAKYESVSVGFGFCEDDFIIVRIESGIRRSKIDVYSLYTDSWKKISCAENIMLSSHIARQGGYCLYWLSNEGKKITAFSLSNERFYTSPLPGSPESYGIKIENKGKLDSVEPFIYDPEDKRFWTWITYVTENPENYQFSWKRKKIISPEIIAYVLQGKTPGLEYHKLPEHLISMRICNYVESLVRVTKHVEQQKSVDTNKEGKRHQSVIRCIGEFLRILPP